MRRLAFALVFLVLAVGFAAGCGGKEEVSPTPSGTTGNQTEPTATEPTATEPTATEPTDTEPTDTEPTETTETTEPPAGGDAVAGKQVFLGASACGQCHVLADAGTEGTVGPNLDESQPDAALVVDRVTNGQGLMPSFSGSLSEKEIADVAAYVSSVAGG